MQEGQTKQGQCMCARAHARMQALGGSAGVCAPAAGLPLTSGQHVITFELKH